MLWVQVVVFVIIGSSIVYPVLRKGYFSQSFVLGNLAVFMLLFILSVVSGLPAQTVLDLAFRPTDLQNLRLHTLISSMFLHLDILHIIGNVLILYLLGLPLEERVRGPRFAAIYLSTGVIATLVYGLVQWGDTTPALGASGAIMGLAGAFVILYPRDRIFMVLIFFILPRVPVYLAVGVITAWQFILLIFGAPGVAVEAHLAGIGAGILIAPLVLRPGLRVKSPATVGLDDLATTEELRRLLEEINAETVEEVQSAWTEYFIQKARCPQCHGPLRKDGRTVSSDCGWRRRL